jgi:hypothetical protein
MTLIEHLEAVHDRESFLSFVQALIWDREDSVAKENQAPEAQRGYGAFGWQNTTIEAYLEAALRYVQEHPEDRDISPEPSWKAFAEFLYVGSIYE